MLWVYLALGPLYVGAAWAIALSEITGHHISVDSGGGLTALDVHGGSNAWFGTVEAVFLVAVVVPGPVWLVGQLISYRHSSGERRLQLKWLLSGATVFIAALIAAVWGLNNPTGPGRAVTELAAIGSLALPVSLGFGILKFRLYEIDRIISRTLAYAIVTGALVGVYAGLVLLIIQVFRFHSTVAVAASTLAAAALFNPLRHRVQRTVDRRFNRARYDADRTVTAFAARLKNAVDLDSVHDDLAAVVEKALEPAHLSVWIRAGERQ